MDLYHTPKPFYRPRKKRWYVQLEGKQINLGPDEDEAFRRYYELMAERAKEPDAPPRPRSEHALVVAIYDAYLEWLSRRVAEGTKAPRTYAWYQKYIQSFVRFAGDGFRVRDLTIDQLEAFHVYAWIDSHADWKRGQRGAMIAVQRPFTWAARAGLLKSIGGRSPLANLEKPQQGRREQLVTEEEFLAILSVLTCPEARDLVWLAWETGMRPHELYTFEARFFESETARIVFPIRLSKGRKVQRVVYLNDRALEIVTRRVVRFPTGPVLRNADGRPWCTSATNCLFQRVRVNLGRKKIEALGLVPPKIKRLCAADRKDKAKRAEHERRVLERRKAVNRLAWEHRTKYSLYAMRHAFCTEALENGLDAVTVSVLMGHRDTTMISRVYSHLDKRHEHLRAAVNQARGGEEASA